MPARALLLAAGQSPVRRGDGGQSDEVEQCLRIVRMGVKRRILGLSVSRSGRGGDATVLQHDADTRFELTVARIEAEHAYRPRVRRAVTPQISTVAVLPAPLGPRIAVVSSRDMSSETPSMAGRSRYRLTRSTTSTAGVVTCGV